MKICHNNCKMGWCCSGESFMSSPERWDKESVEFSKLKGVIPYETTDKNVLYVHIYCPCIQLKDGKCNIHSCKPKGCQDFPTARHEGMAYFSHKSKKKEKSKVGKKQSSEKKFSGGKISKLLTF